MRKNRETAYGVIGLGRFGTALAIALAQAGKEVIAIDRSEEKIKNIRRYTDYAFVAENLSMETLKEIGIQNCDGCDYLYWRKSRCQHLNNHVRNRTWGATRYRKSNQ